MSTTLKLETLVGSVACLQATATFTPSDVEAYHSAGRAWAMNSDKSTPVSELMQGASPSAVNAIKFCESLAKREALELQAELKAELKDELKAELKAELKGELKGEAHERMSALIERFLG